MSEFTTKVRNFVKMYENEIPRRAEINFLEEACGIIDRAKAINKDLLEALVKYGDHLGCCYENLRMGKCNCGLESAIAKAKKEGEQNEQVRNRTQIRASQTR